MDKEPIITVSMVTAFISAVLGLAVAFGVSVTSGQQQAVLTLTGAVCALIIGMGFFGRRFVYSEETHTAEVDAAYGDGHDVGYVEGVVAATPPAPVAPVVRLEPDVAAIITDAQSASFSDPQEEIDLDDDDHSPVVV